MENGKKEKRNNGKRKKRKNGKKFFTWVCGVLLASSRGDSLAQVPRGRGQDQGHLITIDH